jgi:hypothetical protein
MAQIRVDCCKEQLEDGDFEGMNFSYHYLYAQYLEDQLLSQLKIASN